MLPLPRILWHEKRAQTPLVRQPEPASMEDETQVASYVEACAWGGPASILQLHHLRQLSHLVRPGDTVVDLCCGPGVLLLELAALYPEAHFIGVDLSDTMLAHGRSEAEARGLTNVVFRCEDACTLTSFDAGEVDMVMSTSALHHFPDVGSLRQAMKACRRILRPDGAVYFFDFCLLRSTAAVELCVADIDGVAPPITVEDYRLSLHAAFPLQELTRSASEGLGGALDVSVCPLVDLFVFIQSPARVEPSAAVKTGLAAIAQRLSWSMRGELFLLASSLRKKHPAGQSGSRRRALVSRMEISA